MSDPTNTSPRRLATTGRYQPLVVLLAAFCLGIVVDRHFPLSVAVWWTLGAAAWALWFCVWLRQFDRVSACALFVCAAAVGGAWHHMRWSMFSAQDLGRCAREESQPTYVEAVLLNNPRLEAAPPPNPLHTFAVGDQTEVFVRVTGVRDGRAWRSASGRATLTVAGHLIDMRAGDRVRAFAQLSAPAPPLNPGEFDHYEFARTDRRLCSLLAGFPDCVTVVRRGGWWQPRRWLYDLRASGRQLLEEFVGGREAGLAGAVLLGNREQLEPERTAAFFTTGTIHLLAISGLHVGILVYFFWLAARMSLAPRRWTLIAAAVFVVFYALLTDARPPVVRATILIVVFCGARLLGRQAFSFNTLAAAALVVLIWNPAQLFQTGTQLSFLAVATLVVCAPLLVPRPLQDPLDRLIANTRPWPVRLGKRVGGVVGRLWLTSTLIWLVALPLVLYRFHLLSPVAVVLNPLVMLPIAAALFAGFGVLIFGWLIPPLGMACGWVCSTSLSAIEWCIQAGQPIPGSYFWLPGPQWWWVAGFYGGLAFLVAAPRWRPPRRWLAALLAAWLAVGLVSSPVGLRHFFRHRDQLDCTFIAVGHGTSVLVELPGGKTLLYDAGRLGSPTTAARAITSVLWSRGLTHVDAVILSHADADHYNALPESLERVSVGVVYVSPVMFEDTTPALAALRQSIEAYDVPIRLLHTGHQTTLDESVRLEVIHPPPRGVLGSDNANSIVLLIEFAGRRILLPGDLESPGMDDVLAELPLDCDVVMAPHHGSQRSNPRGFAAWCTPEWVIISGGLGRENDEVTDSFRRAGAEVLHTATTGAVQVTMRRDQLQICTRRHRPP